MARVTVSFSGTEDSSERCKQLFPEGKNEAALTALLDAFESKEEQSKALAEGQKQLQTTQNELEQLHEFYGPYRVIVESLCLSHNFSSENLVEGLKNRSLEMNERIEKEREKVKSLQEENRLFGTENELLKSQLINQALTENQLLLNLPDAVVKMLNLTAERLTEKYQVAITPQDVLVKIFVRYTVERFTNWFYNFVLTDVDIEACSGKTVSEWKAFIKGELTHLSA